MKIENTDTNNNTKFDISKIARVKISKEDKKKILKFLFVKPRLKVLILFKLFYYTIIFFVKNSDIFNVLKNNNKEITIKDDNDKIIILQEDILVIFHKSAKANIINFVNRERGNIFLNFLKILHREIKEERFLITPLIFPFNIFFEIDISEIAEKFLPAFEIK